MTRETKIGLLVGLAFIIVIGILLSDHLSINNEPQQATLTQVGQNVRQGAAVPNAAVAIPVPGQAPVAPQAPLPTRQELQPPPPATTIVRITPPAADQSPVVIRPEPATDTPAVTPVIHHAPVSNYSAITQAPEPTAPVVTVLPTPAPTESPIQVLANMTGVQVPTDLLQLAEHSGEAIVPVTLADETAPTRLAVTQTRRYTVVAGDSLSKIALKFYGVDSRANRERIINANPALKANPNLLVIGQSYNVPEATHSQIVPPATETTTPPAAHGDRVYVVQANDSLWKIASKQLGDGNKWKQIADLNRDVLKGSENVRVGMKLRLPV